MDGLFERIGCYDGIEVMAEDFTMRVLKDAELSEYFVSFDQERVTDIHRMGMALLLGASSHSDSWIRDFSRMLVMQAGFSEKQFDRLFGHLVDTLYAFNIGNRDIAEVIDFVQEKRDLLLHKDNIIPVASDFLPTNFTAR